MNIALLAADLARRVPHMQADSPLNNAEVFQREIEREVGPEIERLKARIKELEAAFVCFHCGDGNTPLYCLNCGEKHAKGLI